MDKAQIDELRKETLEQLRDLEDAVDVKAAHKHAVDLLTDFLESLGENVSSNNLLILWSL